MPSTALSQSVPHFGRPALCNPAIGNDNLLNFHLLGAALTVLAFQHSLLASMISEGGDSPESPNIACPVMSRACKDNTVQIAALATLSNVFKNSNFYRARLSGLVYLSACYVRNVCCF